MSRVAALRYRDFRLLWFATLLSSTSRWADVVVAGWLTLELTESPLMVGIVSACRMAGYVAAPFMGVAADRMDRKRLLIIAAVVNCAVTLIMFLLLASGLLTLGYLIGLSLISSATWALDNPTRQAFIPDLVDSEDLTNAIALNAVANELTVVAGPALGGALIPVFGISGAYAMMTIIYFVDAVVLFLLKAVKRSVVKSHESPARSLVSGLRYVWGNPTVLVLLVIAFLLNLFLAPYRYTFLPVFARYVLDAGPAGYGMLTSAAGVGAVLAAGWLMSRGNFKRKGWLVIFGGVGWSVSLLAFAVSKSYYFSLVLAFVSGITQDISWTLIAMLVLTNTAEPMRGRVMGLRTGVIVSLPFGNFIAGAAAERFGAPLAQGAYAVCGLVLMLAIVALVPNLRRLD